MTTRPESQKPPTLRELCHKDFAHDRGRFLAEYPRPALILPAFVESPTGDPDADTEDLGRTRHEQRHRDPVRHGLEAPRLLHASSRGNVALLRHGLHERGPRPRETRYFADDGRPRGRGRDPARAGRAYRLQDARGSLRAPREAALAALTRSVRAWSRGRCAPTARPRLRAVRAPRPRRASRVRASGRGPALRPSRPSKGPGTAARRSPGLVRAISVRARGKRPRGP